MKNRFYNSRRNKVDVLRAKKLREERKSWYEKEDVNICIVHSIVGRVLRGDSAPSKLEIIKSEKNQKYLVRYRY